MSAKKSLDSVRREIDAIDDAIHDLLVKRAKVVEKIGALKGGDGANLRPGREANILRRLVGRHAGGFPKPILVRIWREMFSAHVRQQGPFSVAVYAGGNRTGYRDLARDQYGSCTPMTMHQSASRVIDTVARGEATVGVLPVPGQEDAEPWWPQLTSQGTNAPRIIARLPFAGSGDAQGGDWEAVAIGRLAPEPTGHDRTYVAIDAAEEIAPSRLAKGLADSGLAATPLGLWHNEQTPGAWLHLAEVEGFLDPDNRLLRGITSVFEGLVKQTVLLGGYAVPLSPKELAPTPRAKRKRRS